MGAAEIAVGDVFHLRCNLCNPPKNKFFVVALHDPLKMFLINSDATDFQKSSPAIMAAQARIFASEHTFLEYDSLIGCDHLTHEYRLDQLRDLVLRNPTIRIGHLSDRAKEAVGQALKGNELIPRKYLRALGPCWGSNF